MEAENSFLILWKNILSKFYIVCFVFHNNKIQEWPTKNHGLNSTENSLMELKNRVMTRGIPISNT